jgi:hypothetical protein
MSNSHLNIQLSPTAKATYVQSEHCCGYVRVTGWIKADSQVSGLEAGALIGGLFGRKSSGGFSADGTFMDFPFSFDVAPEYLSNRGRMEDKDECLARVQKTLRNAQRNLTRVRNTAIKTLEMGAFEYVK